MINVGTFVICCICSLLVGMLLGEWSSNTSKDKLIDDLSRQHDAEIQLIVNKILECRKEKNNNDRT